MAKPDDTRIALASENTSSSSTNKRITPTPPTNAAFIHMLEALLGKLKADKPAPLPSKSARPPTIKPRRRVTVNTDGSPASDANTPRIRLCGNWLAFAGFGPHTRVRVHVAKGCLILIPEDAD